MNKSGAHILVVDDEVEIVRALQKSLTAHGYKVFTARSGEEAFQLISKHRPDLLLLDLVLPGMSGLEVCRLMRTQSNIPIIVLSVKGSEHDKVEALDLGADDYVSKPFGIDEVLARVRVALRHAAQIKAGTQPNFCAGPLKVDFARRQVQLHGQDVQLTPTEFDLLKVLIAHHGKILTRQMLLKEIWGPETHARTHSLHVYMAQLRRKIEQAPEEPHFIITVPGVGYRFNEESE
jgi:two-component system, OmpR family, KDP operon response regulator KdpE